MKINDSKYSFEIQDNGKVKLYRLGEDVTNELNYNIVTDMAYMIQAQAEALKQAERYKGTAKSAIDAYLNGCELTHDDILDDLGIDDEEFKDIMGYELERDDPEEELD